jgi:ATP adenylyltransferase
MTPLWTPWRSDYIKEKRNKTICIFCNAAAHPESDELNLVVYRCGSCFVLLNRYPYTSGHVMIAPYSHVSRLSQIDDSVAEEMMRIARRSERLLEKVYGPDGLNVGMNLGEAAGAGIEEHIHLHVLPRWKADANFMTPIANTRVIPEALEDTYAKLKAAYVNL